MTFELVAPHHEIEELGDLLAKPSVERLNSAQ